MTTICKVSAANGKEEEARELGIKNVPPGGIEPVLTGSKKNACDRQKPHNRMKYRVGESRRRTVYYKVDEEYIKGGTALRALQALGKKESPVLKKISHSLCRIPI